MKKISLLTCLILCTTHLFAQILTPVKWSYASKVLNKHEAVILIKATIENGWHIYSINQEDGGPVKTSIHFAASPGYQLVGLLTEPKPVIRFEKTFGINVSYFENSVVFQQKLRLKKKDSNIKVKVNFMVCNEEKCLPPQDVSFNIPVNSKFR